MGIQQMFLGVGGGGPSIISTGGVKIEDPGTERTYHVFNYDNAPPTSAAPFTVSAPQDIYYLVIGGGGGGGYNSGGGNEFVVSGGGVT